MHKADGTKVKQGVKQKSILIFIFTFHVNVTTIAEKLSGKSQQRTIAQGNNKVATMLLCNNEVIAHNRDKSWQYFHQLGIEIMKDNCEKE